MRLCSQKYKMSSVDIKYCINFLMQNIHSLLFKKNFRDCIYPVNVRETRIRVCIQATLEWLNTEWPLKQDKFFWDTPDGIKYAAPPYLIFYECMIALNVETIDEDFEDKEIRRSGKSFSRDYEMLTIEICFLGKGSLKKFHKQYIG